jgi:hypothetical protein
MAQPKPVEFGDDKVSLVECIYIYWLEAHLLHLLLEFADNKVSLG